MASPLSRSRAWTLTIVATLTMAISYFDRQTLAVLSPTVTKALSINETQYGWLASAFSVAYLVGAPLAGRAIDRVGARRGLLGAVSMWSIIAALHAITPGFASLFALRLALGLAESPSFPASAQIVQRALPPAERARGFGVLFTGSSIGAMTAPLVATFLESRFGWRVAFLGTAGIGLLWVPLWLRVAFAPQVRSVIDGVREGPPAPSLGIFEVALHPAVLRATLLVIACVPLIGFMLTWGAKFLVTHHGLTQASIGRYLWMPPLFYDLGSLFFGDRASRRATRRRGAPDVLLVAIAGTLATTVMVVASARGPWSAMIGASVAMAGGGGIFALLTSDMMMRVPTSAVSLAGGVCAAAQSLVLIVVNPIIGRVIDRTFSYTPIILALGAWVVPFCALWIFWKPPPLDLARLGDGHLEDAVSSGQSS